MFGWGTAGLYFLYWAYRIGQARRSMGQQAVAPALHALGFLVGPVNAFLLARLGRLADAARGRAPGWHWPLLGVLYLAAVVGMGSLEVTLPFLVLLPLPVVLVQRAMNAAWSDDRPPARPRWRDAPGILACALVLFGLWSADHAALRAWVSPEAPPAKPVRGLSGDYELVPADGGWAVVPAGTNGEPDADLELQSRYRRAWVVVYRVADANASIDGAIEVRFTLMEQSASVVGFTEQRSLEFGPEGPVTTSRASFEGDGLFGRERFAARIIRANDRIYEAIGWAESSRYIGAVERLLDSFELSAEPAP